MIRSSYSDTGTAVLSYLPKGTRLSVRGAKRTDANGKIWRYVALHVQTNRYVGYIPEESITMLAMNQAAGKTTAAVTLRAQPLTSAASAGTLASGTASRFGEK